MTAAPEPCTSDCGWAESVQGWRSGRCRSCPARQGEPEAQASGPALHNRFAVLHNHWGAIRWGRHIGDVHQFHVEDEIGFGRNHRVSWIWPDAASFAVSQLVGNEQATLAANLHAGKSLVKAGNQPAIALRESHGLRRTHLGFAVCAHHRLTVLVSLDRSRMVIGRIELFAV